MEEICYKTHETSVNIDFEEFEFNFDQFVIDECMCLNNLSYNVCSCSVQFYCYLPLKEKEETCNEHQ